MRTLCLLILLAAALFAGACSPRTRFLHDAHPQNPVNRSMQVAMRQRTNHHRDYRPARHYQFKKARKPTYRVHLPGAK